MRWRRGDEVCDEEEEMKDDENKWMEKRRVVRGDAD
jgi:hypothetical protein